MTSLRVLIVGASIAGPTTAYWFAKAGASVTVIERFPSLRTGGQNVDIRSVGVAIMRMMPGLEAAVRGRSVQMDGICFVRTDGSHIGTISATGNPDNQSLVSEYEIYRGDLAKILYDMTKQDERVTYVFGEQVASIRSSDGNQDGPVTVSFANGYQSAEFDLVVACDGATSRTRAIGFCCDSRDHIESSNSWAAWFSMHRDVLDGSKLGHSYSAAGGRFMATGTDPSGTSRGTFLNFGADSIQPYRQAMAKGQDAVKDFIAQHYAGSGWKSDDLIEGMLLAGDFYTTEIVNVKPPHLFHGRVVLVGDAGYASGAGGVGTSLAMAGAYILAGEVAKHPGELLSALASYERQLRPIINGLQNVSPVVSTILAPQTKWGLRVRNLLLGFACWSGVVGFTHRYVAGAFASGEKYRVPEYSWPGDVDDAGKAGLAGQPSTINL